MSSSAFTPVVLTVPATGTSGTGQGELNVVTNPSATTNTSGWTASTPANLSRDASGSPLDPVIPTGFSIVSTASGQTLTSDSLTVPASLRNRKLKLEFYMTQATSAFKVDVLNSSDVRFPLTTDASGASNLPALSASGKYTTYFDMDSGSSIKVRFTSIATSGTLKVTQVIVGPGIQPQGAVVSSLGSVTVTPAGFGTVSGGTYRAWRTGTKMRITGRWVSGTSSATTASIALPAGYTIDTSALPAVASGVRVGTWETINSGAAAFVYNGSSSYSGIIFYDGSDSGNVYITARVGSNAYVKTAGNVLSGIDGNNFIFDFEVPIAEWAGSGTVQLAQNDVEYVSHDGTSIVRGPSGALIPTTTPAGSSTSLDITSGFTNTQPSDRFVLEIQRGGVGAWVSAGTAQIENFRFDGTNFIGASVDSSSSTILLRRGKYAIGINGVWSAIEANSRWRVRKSSAGASVGFGIVQPGTSSGLVSASGLPGNTTGNAIASGFVGERKPFTSRAVVCTNAASWYGNSNALTTLTTGVWLVVVKGSWVGNNTANAITFGYATNGASNDTGLIEVEAAVNAQNANASSGPVYTSTYYYITTTDTPIYGKAVSEDQSALTVTIGGFAIRIA